MSYVQEYEEFLTNLHPTYQPLLKNLKEIIRLTDQIFIQQIDSEYGLYPADIKFWLNEYPDYEAQPYAVLRVENGELVEIPYHKYFQNITQQILLLLDIAKQNIEQVHDEHFNKAWWAIYIDSLKLGYAKDNWAASEKVFLSSPDENPILLTIGPIDEYHDKVKGRKKLFSAWLLIKKPDAHKQATTLWQQLVEIERTIPGTTYYGIPFKTNHKIRLYVGDLLYGGGEFAKFDSMGSSRPQNTTVFDKYGSLKLIAYNKFQEHTAAISEDISTYSKIWEIPPAIEKKVKDFHDANALLPLLLHEFGHTYLKSEKSLHHLDQYYAFIEETRAQINMVHLALRLGETGKLPKDTAKNIFLREFFYLPYLYEGYKIRHQREAYLYAAVMVAFGAKNYGLVDISDSKITINEKTVDQKLSEMILDVRTFLYTLSYFGTDKEELQKHKDFMFGYCEEIATVLSINKILK